MNTLTYIPTHGPRFHGGATGDPVAGMRKFMALWFGQTVSLIGSHLTSFALGVWVYQQTGSASWYAVATFLAVAPELMLAPLAGGMSDRRDRRLVMMAGHFGAGLSALTMAILWFWGGLEVWSAMGLIAIASCFSAAQHPAFSAAMTDLVAEQDFGRANGLLQMSFGLANLVAPISAAYLMGNAGLGWIFAIDAVSFLIAIGVLFAVRFSSHQLPPDLLFEGNVRAEVRATWHYLRGKRGLWALLWMQIGANFALGIVAVTFTPLVLSFGSIETLGMILSTGAIGGLIGGILLAIWGGPRRRVMGVIGFSFAQGALLCLAIFRPSTALISLVAFGYFFTLPFVFGCNQTIWQQTVPPIFQGRILGFRRAVAMSAQPIAFLSAGPIVELLLGPAMTTDGLLGSSMGVIMGTGPGRGAALLIVCVGVGVGIMTLIGALNPSMRRVENSR